MIRKEWIAMLVALASSASAVVLAQSTVPASDPAPTTLPAPDTRPSPEALHLIDLLGAPKFLTRAHAQADLIRMGKPVEPALNDAIDESSSAEIRARAATAVMQIEQNIADAPTYVTLRETKASVDSVLQDLGRQSKTHVIFANGTDPITLNLDHVTFWTAMQAICTATHSHPQFMGNGVAPGQITLVPGEAGRWDQHGRFAFIPMTINHDSSMDLLNGGAGKNDMLMMMVFLDPKFHSATFDGLQLSTATDELGVSLVTPGMMAPNFFFGAGFQQGWAYSLNAPLNFPETFGHTLTRLQGSITAHLPMGSDTLKIPDMAKAIGTVTVGGNHKIAVIQCNYAGGNTVTMHLQIGKLERTAGLNYPGGLFAEFNSARVYDSQGVQLLPGGGGGGTDMQIDWQGQFISPGRPIKPPFSLSWEIVTKTETVTVPFKFKNLPLPPQ